MKLTLIKSSLYGALIGIVFGAAAVFLLGAVALNTKDPDSLTKIVAHLARFLGAAAAGFAASKFNREKGLLVGSLSGVIYSLLLMLGSAFFDNNFKFFLSLLFCLICILISALFGILGLPKAKSSLARRKEFMKRGYNR